jgi:hypothetical protein
MIKSANVIAGAFNSIARLVSTVIPGNVIKVNGEYRLKSELPGTQQSSSTRVKDYVVMAKTTKARKDELAILTASNKAKTEIDKLKDKFDLERISLTAALNAATDEETKLRIKAQLAILDNNEALARKYLAEMNAAESIKKLADDAFRAGSLLVDGAAAAFARLALYNPVTAMSPGQGGGGGISNVPAVPFVGTPFGQAGGNTGAINATPVEITLELAPNAGEFGQLIYNSFLMNQKNGLNQVPAGSL